MFGFGCRRSKKRSSDRRTTILKGQRSNKEECCIRRRIDWLSYQHRDWIRRNWIGKYDFLSRHRNEEGKCVGNSRLRCLRINLDQRGKATRTFDYVCFWIQVKSYRNLEGRQRYEYLPKGSEGIFEHRFLRLNLRSRFLRCCYQDSNRVGPRTLFQWNGRTSLWW